MYRGKRRHGKGTKAKRRQAGRICFCMLLFGSITGIFTFMALIVLAAPASRARADNRPVNAEIDQEAGTEIGQEAGAEISQEAGDEMAASVSGNEISNEEKVNEEKAVAEETYIPPVEADAVMYLTFDDGPSAECTEMVLNTLKEKNIKATFFLIGEYVEKYPEVAKRIAAEGHTIGIHCYRHDYGVIYESTESYLADFQQACDVIYEITGVETKLFRFPGGSVNAYNKEVREDIIKEMTGRGFIYFDWNASLEDAAGKYEPWQLIENARNTTLGRKRIVMLAHDRVLNTALCLGDLIDQFPEYKMEPLTDETEPIQFRIP